MDEINPQEELPEQPQLSEQQQERVSILRARIADEYDAIKQAMKGYGRVASHKFIDARFRAIGEEGSSLGDIVGKGAAKTMIYEQYQRTFD